MPVPSENNVYGRVTVVKTATGKTVLKVAVLASDAIHWRTYEHHVGCDTDAAVARALKSLGLPSAWVWGRLL